MAKWSLLLSILVFCSTGIASDNIEEIQAPVCEIPSSHFTPAVLFSAPLEWWSVSPQQVAGAPCKNVRAPTDSEMLSRLQSSTLRKRSENHLSISFKNDDPELLQLFRDLHAYDITMINAKPLSLKSHCNQVICSAQSIYGPRVGIQLLYMLKQFGFNGSHLRTIKASAWRSDELDDILAALSDYPLELYPLEYNRRLIHATRGSSMKLPEGESVANSTMEIYDAWNKLTPAERQQTLLHELGHIVGRKGGFDESAEWLKVSGWIRNPSKGTYTLVDPSKAVSLYGKTNPSEDFAETVVAYRFGGVKLKSEQPEKYEYLKNRVFDGKEYLSPTACFESKSQTETKRIANNVLYNGALAKAKKNANKLDSSFIEQTQRMCLQSLLKVMVNESGSSESCTSRSLQRLQLVKASKGKKLNADLLTDAQLNAIIFSAETEADFSQRVRTKFSIDAAKSFSSEFSASVSRGPCSDWGKSAQVLFMASPFLSELNNSDRNFFFINHRYEKLQSFFERVCQSARQNSGRLDVGILSNLP